MVLAKSVAKVAKVALNRDTHSITLFKKHQTTYSTLHLTAGVYITLWLS